MQGHIPRKRFGQNFLHDPYYIGQIVEHIHPRPGEAMVEIGPGLGALTVPVLQILKKIQVVELDRDVIPLLLENTRPWGEVIVHQSDALKFDFRQLASPEHKIRVIGNLPYNISTPLLFHLFEQKAVIRDMTFMLQKEVVDRLTAAPDTKAYGRLSIMAQYFCHCEKLFEVPPGAFNPPPKVDSAIVSLIPHEKPPVDVINFAFLEELVQQAFNQRRKTLRNTLKKWLDNEQMEKVELDISRRPDTLSLQEYAYLANLICEAKA